LVKKKSEKKGGKKQENVAQRTRKGEGASRGPKTEKESCPQTKAGCKTSRKPQGQGGQKRQKGGRSEHVKKLTEGILF